MPPLLISNLINILYLSGVKMTAGLLLMTSRKKYLFADGRYIEKAKSTMYDDVTVLPINEITKYINRYKKLRFEADDVTVNKLQRWEKQYRGTRLIPSSGIVEDMRRIKHNNELRHILKACKITDAIFKLIPKKLTPDISEKRLAQYIQQLAQSLGADKLAFDTIVSFGSNTSQPHHEPTNRKLKKGDIVQIDMGVKVNEYCSDCSRVFFTGKKTNEQKIVFDLLLKTVRECTKKAKHGITNYSLDAHARAMLAEEGFEEYFTHGLGHGLGLNIHEGASISPRATLQKLRKNEVITIEPGIYIPGKWGMRIEDTILVRKNGGKRLTQNCLIT